MLHYYLLQNLGPLENLLSFVFSSSKDAFFTGHMNFQEVSITLQLFITTFSFFLHVMDKYLMRHSAHSFLRFRWSVQHHSVTVICYLMGADTWSFALAFLDWLYTSATPSSRGVPLWRMDLEQEPVWQILAERKFEPQRKTCTNNQEKVCMVVRNGDHIMWLQLFLFTLGLSFFYSICTRKRTRMKKTCWTVKCNSF